MGTGAYLPEIVSKDLTSSASGHSIVPKWSTEGWLAQNGLLKWASEGTSLQVWNRLGGSSSTVIRRIRRPQRDISEFQSSRVQAGHPLLIRVSGQLKWLGFSPE